ncbi:DinB family protein [Cohnella cellulosilytica]|uniref:DinB family protein n=1 Tax=Cohnella cellulosilytica TaxID=986710 RepID=A0ABW2FGI3_9BACL
MLTTIAAFAAEWENEAELTERVLDRLTDESLRQEMAAGRRTLGALAWHLVSSIGYAAALGLRIEGADEEKRAPARASEIAKEYRRMRMALLQAVREQWSDESLGETQTVAGEEWRNGATLRFMLMHQAHHRGQMTALMRQAGLRPPEIYGPTYETWIDKGMEPLA